MDYAGPETGDAYLISEGWVSWEGDVQTNAFCQCPKDEIDEADTFVSAGARAANGNGSPCHGQMQFFGGCHGQMQKPPPVSHWGRLQPVAERLEENLPFMANTCSHEGAWGL